MAFYLTDEERCPFGLGWEYKRRGRPLDDCPFKPGTRRYEEFVEGFQQFICTDHKKTSYDDK